jgi:hypothetical protein
MCQAAYKICSHQAILSIRLQGKLKDDSGAALFPSIEEKKRQVNAARTLSDVFENSIGVALQNQIHEQLAPFAGFAGHQHSTGGTHAAFNDVTHPSQNFACLPLVGGGAVASLPQMNIDSGRLEEEMYTNAALALVRRMKPEVSTHDTTMQGLGALLGNSTVINTAVGELDTRSLPSSRRKHRATNNRLLIGDLNGREEATTRKKKAKTNLYPGLGAPSKDPPTDVAAQDASCRE